MPKILDVPKSIRIKIDVIWLFEKQQLL